MSAANPRVLIIDDNPANLSVASGHLSDFGVVVLTARDGETGVARARRARPELVLLDVEMPGIDGFEVCRRLQADARTADIPVLFMTSRADPNDKVRGFEVGAVDYVTKPFDGAELVARVKTHITLVRQRRQLAEQAQIQASRATEATERLRQELAERRAVAAERQSLGTLVRVQSEQLVEQTRRWLAQREDEEVGLAQPVRVDVLERIRLAVETLERVQRLQPSNGIDRALELLAPALPTARGVESAHIAGSVGNDSPLQQLSSREVEVFRLLTKGRSNKEIAYTLGVTPSTVSTYRGRIFEKLGVNDLPALIRLGIQYPEAR